MPANDQETMMKTAFSLRHAGLAAVVTLALAVVALPLAHSQAQPPAQAAPNFLPMGVSSSGNTSTAWFHEPSSGRAMACQAQTGAGGAISGIQCVTTKLP
jgi:hypothetical protein